MKVPFNQPFLSGQELEAIREALASGKHCGNGKFGRLCEQFIRDEYGVKKVFLVPSGTAALEMASILAGISPGDEVIMPSYTFSSTANAFCIRGAKPIFADIEPDTFTMDYRSIEELVTKRTKAIVPINYGGVSPNLESILDIADRRKLIVIEDAAQGIGAKYKGRSVGSIAPISVFSFHETKNISCGEGGAVLLNQPQLEELGTFVQEKGTDRSRVVSGLQSKYSWVSLGSSYLLSEVLAAMLSTQLSKHEEIQSIRGATHRFYSELFGKYVERGDLKIQRIPDYCVSNYHGFYLVFPKAEQRDKFIGFMMARGISCYIGYLPLHNSKMGLNIEPKVRPLPVTEYIADRIVRMPLHCSMTHIELDYISKATQEFFK